MGNNNLQFTDVIPAQKIRGVYLLWKEGEVVYVGQSKNIANRIGQHLEIMKEKIDGYSFAAIPHGDLDDIEAGLIVQHNPNLNNKLPPNTYYFHISSLKEELQLKGKQFQKFFSGVKPAWRNYYKLTDLKDCL